MPPKSTWKASSMELKAVKDESGDIEALKAALNLAALSADDKLNGLLQTMKALAGKVSPQAELLKNF